MTLPGAPLAEKWVSALFSKLKAIYGQRWVDRFSTEMDIALASEEWAKGLRGMTPEQISAALDVCRTEHSWPPGSPAEFRQRGVVKMAPCHRLAAKPLSRPKADPETAKQELRRMRNIMRQVARVSLWARLHGMRAYC